MNTRAWLLVAVLASACTFCVSAAGADSLQFSEALPVDAMAKPIMLSSVSCSSTTQCTAVDEDDDALDATAVTFDPSTVTALSAPITNVDDGARRTTSVSCVPNADQCTAVDDGGYEVTFDPATGAAISGPVDIDGSAWLFSVSCPSSGQCTAIDTTGYEVTFDPATGAALAGDASGPQDVDSGGEPLTSISCFSTAICVVVDNQGNVVTFNPSLSSVTATVTNVGAGLNAVSCPSADQCTAVSGGSELTFDPVAVSPFSATVDFHYAMSSVSCPSTTQCTGVDSEGEEVTFVPATGHIDSEPSQPVSVDTNIFGPQLTSVSCPSTGLCTAVDANGNEVTFNPLTVNVGDETSTPVDRVSAALTSASCPSGSQCTAVDNAGNEVTFNPATGAAVAGGASGSQLIDNYVAQTNTLTSVSCPSIGQCTAVDELGSEVTFNPANGSALYSLASGPQYIDDDATELVSVSCPSLDQCTAVDDDGKAVTFDPADALTPGGGIVAPMNIGIDSAAGLACPSINQCTAVDGDGNEVTFDPLTGAAISGDASGPQDIDASETMSGLACPSAGQCTATDDAGNEVTFDPATGQAVSGYAAGPESIDAHSLISLSCPSTEVCYAVDSVSGEISFDPADPGTPVSTTVGQNHHMAAISCFSASECVLVDIQGDAYLGTGPASSGGDGNGGTSGDGTSSGDGNGAATTSSSSDTSGSPPAASTSAGSATDAGRLILIDRTARLVGHVAGLSVRCDSQQACHVRLTLTTRGRIRSRDHLQTLTCASASAEIAPDRTGRIAMRVKASCLVLLRQARRHTLSTALSARASTGQAGLAAKVSLKL